MLIDDMGWRDLGYSGSDLYETPNIDRISSQGIRFTRAYSAHPVCSPTRAAIMTGKNPVRLGITDWIPGDRPDDRPLRTPEISNHLSLKEQTLAKLLKKEGYRTFSIGKWHLGGAGYLPTDQGFDVNIGGSHVGQPGSYFSPFGKDVTPIPGDVQPGEFLTDRLTSEAIQLIDQKSDKPFFLYFPQYAVHMPIQAKQEDIDRFIGPAKSSTVHHNTKYAGLIWNLDQNVGRLIEHLEQTGNMNDTLFLFTSDNGGLLPITNNAPLRAGKGFPYEGGVRVPGFAYWPGHIPAGKKVDDRVISMDFSATVLEAAGSKAKVQDGSSFYRALTGQPFHQSRPFVWHYPQYHGSGNTPCSAMLDGKYKVVHHYETGLNELYDLEKDPSENTNLAVVKPELASKLWLKLKRLLDSMGALYPVPRR
jgi:arylsulfatase A-like enzyme